MDSRFARGADVHIGRNLGTSQALPAQRADLDKLPDSPAAGVVAPHGDGTCRARR